MSALTTPPGPSLAATTNGRARRRITFDELLRMFETGVLDYSENVELIDGEIITMAAKGNRHEIVRNELTLFFGAKRPPDLKFGCETPLHLDATNAPEPDFMFHPAHLTAPEVDGRSVLLVVEVSDTTLGYDLGIKSRLYAAFGVREYWVIDVNRLLTHVHLAPVGDKYTSVEVVPTKASLSITPSFDFRVSDLGFGWDDGKTVG